MIHKATSKSLGQSAFSLVEVTLALGVAAFCLLAIFGLLPVGMNSNQASIEQTVASSIARAIITDLRIAPISPVAATVSGTSPQYLFEIPAPGPNATSTVPKTLFFAEDGSPTGKVDEDAQTGAPFSRYRASLWFTPPGAGARNSTAVRLLITWPALADQKANLAPKNYAGSFETVTTLDRN